MVNLYKCMKLVEACFISCILNDHLCKTIYKNTYESTWKMEINFVLLYNVISCNIYFFFEPIKLQDFNLLHGLERCMVISVEPESTLVILLSK